MSTELQKKYVQYGQDNISYDFKDNFSFYLFKKIEKLVLAIHLITDHLSDKDPIRQNVRSTATSLIKDIINSTEKDERNMQVVQTSLLQISSLLGLGAMAGLLTNANASIVRDEISRISKELATHKSALDGNAVVKRSFFMVDIPKDIERSDIKVIEDELQTHSNIEIEKEEKDISRTPSSGYKSAAEIIEKNKELYTTEKKGDSSSRVSSENKVIEKKVVSVKKTPPINSTSIEGKIKKTKRADEIISIIKDKKKVMIKDISSEITGCSEKTIQRELQKLVANGILHKEGERRWSTYTLA